MQSLSFYSNGKLWKFSIPASVKSRRKTTSPGDESFARFSAHHKPSWLDDLFSSFQPAEALVIPQPKTKLRLIPTETITVEGAGKAELKILRERFGLEIVREGLFGKTLLRNTNEGGPEAVRKGFEHSRLIMERGRVTAAHPNFIRMFDHTDRRYQPHRSTELTPWWNHQNNGTIGRRGADAAIRAAWTIHRGSPDIRVAVLDEGVDVHHADLHETIVDQKDFVDFNPTAMPDGDDAHGTACAGIIAGRSQRFPGIANCSIVAARIAKGDGHGNWIFDDFGTADAIDWSWHEAHADVLSNSWGGGPPVDAITNAFTRARTLGRNKNGAVIVVAAGNHDGEIEFPGSIPEVLCVGATNEWDERKSTRSRDGETHWGSCYGKSLSLVAPGVHIATTDLSGKAGYGEADHILGFNGTSAATPHVAAAAALILSISPQLTQEQVRKILTDEATKLKSTGEFDSSRKWNPEMGWGRLDIFAALRRASRS